MKKALLFIFAFTFSPDFTLAQGINFSSSDTNPIEVTASDGIELHQKSNKVVARGKAIAKRSGSTLSSDVIEAYYRSKKPQGNEIYRLKATGNVVMKYSEETAKGKEAEYSLDISMLSLKGEPAEFTTKGDIVTAKTLEYWQKQELVIAKDSATLQRDNRSISADKISALFSKDKDGQLVVEKMQADGNVIINTEKEQATGDVATYNPKTGVAILLGNVKLTQNGNYMTGEKAVVNLSTGISKLYANSTEKATEGRVKGLFLPQSAKKDNLTPVRENTELTEQVKKEEKDINDKR